MTLVLSMNPFCDHAASEGDPAAPQYQPIWESERFSKSCVSSSIPLECAVEQLAEEPLYRRAPDHVAASRIAYFKRKYVEDEDSHLTFRSCCQTVMPALEERAHVLRVSLDKLRFIEDPEAFLRRSVLVNNLLRRLRAEIFLQSDWCFPPPPPCSPPSPSSSPAPPCPWEAPPPRPCFAGPLAAQGPYRKRFRLIRGEGEECFQGCCCFYGGRYLRLPFPVCEEAASSSHCPSSSSSSSSSSSPLPQLLPLEGGETRLDLFYPCLDLPPPVNQVELEVKERSKLRDKTGFWEGAHGRVKTADKQHEKREGHCETAGHSSWSVDTSEAGQEPMMCCQMSRKI